MLAGVSRYVGVALAGMSATLPKVPPTGTVLRRYMPYLVTPMLSVDAVQVRATLLGPEVATRLVGTDGATTSGWPRVAMLDIAERLPHGELYLKVGDSCADGEAASAASTV